MHEFWVPGDLCDPGYKNIRDLDHAPCPKIRRILESYWDECKLFTDKDFREEFSRQPYARFWELYLIHRLLSARKPVVDRKRRPANGPDILIEGGDGRFWIEAVTFGQGDETNPDRVPEMKFGRPDAGEPFVVQNDPVKEVELRISSVFVKKSEKLKKYAEKGIISAADRNIIAINPGNVSMLAEYIGRGSPQCVLYPLGDQYVTLNKDSDVTDSGYHPRMEIKKSSGKHVPIGMFANEQHNHISGVIWSKTTLGNFFNDENDLTLYHNATPAHSVPRHWLNWCYEWEATIDKKGQITLTELSNATKPTTA